MTNFKHEIWKKSTPRGEGWERPHRKQKTMCPADHRHEDQPSEPPAAPPPADGNDSLANFALGEVQRQAAERGEEVTEVDVSFVQRAPVYDLNILNIFPIMPFFGPLSPCKKKKKYTHTDIQRKRK